MLAHHPVEDTLLWSYVDARGCNKVDVQCDEDEVCRGCMHACQEMFK